METVWKSVKSAIKQRIPSHSFNMWIEPLKVSQIEETAWVISCPNFFSRKRVEGLYGAMIEKALQHALGKECQISFTILNNNGSSNNKASHHIQLPLPNEQLRPRSGHLFRKDFTFDSFVVGGNNDYAYSASLSLASCRRTQQPALFLMSKTGMGKSHLAQAIGHHILSQCPSERVYYITAEDFTNEMIYALRHDGAEAFQEKYRNQCDVLLLEDVQFLSGKERTQFELTMTLDTLLDSGKKIIFSCCY